MTLNVAWLSVPDGFAQGFGKMLIYWDFHPDTTISRVSSERETIEWKAAMGRKKSCWCWATGERAEWLQVTIGNKLILKTTCICQYASMQKTMMSCCRRGAPWVPLLSAKHRKLRLQLTVCNISWTRNYMMHVACYYEPKSLRNVSSTWIESLPQRRKAPLETERASNPAPDTSQFVCMPLQCSSSCPKPDLTLCI